MAMGPKGPNRRQQGMAEQAGAGVAQDIQERKQINTAKKADYGIHGPLIGGKNEGNMNLQGQVDTSNPYPFLAKGIAGMGAAIERGNAQSAKVATDTDRESLAVMQDHYDELMHNGKVTEAERYLRDFDYAEFTTDKGRRAARSYARKTAGPDEQVQAQMMQEMDLASSQAAHADAEGLNNMLATGNSFEQKAALGQMGRTMQIRNGADEITLSKQASVAAVNHMLTELPTEVQLAIVDGSYSFKDAIDASDLEQRVKDAAIANFPKIGLPMLKGNVHAELGKISADIGPERYDSAVEYISKASNVIDQTEHATTLIQSVVNDKQFAAHDRLTLLDMLADRAKAEKWQAADQVERMVREVSNPLIAQMAISTSDDLNRNGQTPEQQLHTMKTFQDRFNASMMAQGQDLRMMPQELNPALYDFKTKDGSLIDPTSQEYTDLILPGASKVVDAWNNQNMRGGDIATMPKSMQQAHDQYIDGGIDSPMAWAEYSSSPTNLRDLQTFYRDGQPSPLGPAIDDTVYAFADMLDEVDAENNVSPSQDSIRMAILADAMVKAQTGDVKTLDSLIDDSRTGMLSSVATIAGSRPEVLLAYTSKFGEASLNRVMLKASTQDGLTGSESAGLRAMMGTIRLNPEKYIDEDGDVMVEMVRSAYSESSMPNRGVTDSMVKGYNLMLPEIRGNSSWQDAIDALKSHANGINMSENPNAEQLALAAQLSFMAGAVPEFLAQRNLATTGGGWFSDGNWSETSINLEEVQVFMSSMLALEGQMEEMGGRDKWLEMDDDGAMVHQEQMTTMLGHAVDSSMRDLAPGITPFPMSKSSEEVRSVSEWTSIPTDAQPAAAMLYATASGLGEALGLSPDAYADQESLIRNTASVNGLNLPDNMGSHTTLIDILEHNGADFSGSHDLIEMEVATVNHGSAGSKTMIGIVDGYGNGPFTLTLPTHLTRNATTVLDQDSTFSNIPTYHSWDGSQYLSKEERPFMPDFTRDQEEAMGANANVVEQGTDEHMLDFMTPGQSFSSAEVIEQANVSWDVAREQVLEQVGPGNFHRMDEYVYFPVPGKDLMVMGFKKDKGATRFKPMGELRRSSLGDGIGDPSIYEVRGGASNRVKIPRRRSDRNSEHFSSMEAFINWNATQ